MKKNPVIEGTKKFQEDTRKLSDIVPIDTKRKNRTSDESERERKINS